MKNTFVGILIALGISSTNCAVPPSQGENWSQQLHTGTLQPAIFQHVGPNIHDALQGSFGFPSGSVTFSSNDHIPQINLRRHDQNQNNHQNKDLEQDQRLRKEAEYKLNIQLQQRERKRKQLELMEEQRLAKEAEQLQQARIKRNQLDKLQKQALEAAEIQRQKKQLQQAIRQREELEQQNRIRNQAAERQRKAQQQQKAEKQRIIKEMKNKYKNTKTSIGTVYQYPLSKPVPRCFRKVKLSQGKTIKEDLNKLLDWWGVIAFETGKLDGKGYGNKFMDSYGSECGFVFIVESSC